MQRNRLTNEQMGYLVHTLIAAGDRMFRKTHDAVARELSQVLGFTVTPANVEHARDRIMERARAASNMPVITEDELDEGPTYPTFIYDGTNATAQHRGYKPHELSPESVAIETLERLRRIETLLNRMATEAGVEQNYKKGDDPQPSAGGFGFGSLFGRG